MIYFVQAEKHGIKIGKTILAPERRIADMQVGCPIKLTLLGLVEGGKKREKELHKRFESCRLRGEWFTMDIIQEVQGLISNDPNLMASRLSFLNRQIGKLKDIDILNKLVHEKEMLLKLTWL